MNRQMLMASLIALALMAGTGLLLNQERGRQALGPPGVKTHPLPGSIRLQADLPEQVLDYRSESMDIDDVSLRTLPNDTSFGQCRYKGPDGFSMDLRVVLMGHDRTSLHKPQYCFPGMGWHIDDAASTETRVRVERPYAYDLPLVELVINRTATIEGQPRRVSGIYAYWYVADDAVSGSTSGLQRVWWLASRLLRTGVLQRWAYVSCFAVCAPGQETETFNRMKQFIAAAVPQFQLYPRQNAIAMSSAP